MRYMVKNQNPIQIYYGGSSSGKSHAIAQRVILDTLEGRNYLIVRKTGDSLRRSTFNEVVSKIYDLQVQQYFTINKAEMLITCGLHNKQIMFKGLDDVEKLKSIKPLNGVITDIWLEEATECSYNDYKQLDKRLRGKSNFVKRITFSFNPIVRSHWIYEEFFKDRWVDGGQYVESDGVSILKTTYRDNQFLAPDDIERLESEKDPYYRMVYLDGEWGVLKGIVYDNWEIKNFDKNSFANYRIGVDWGFSCLCGETLIATNKGQVKIKDIKEGDYVLTRDGYRKVTNHVSRGQSKVYAVDFGYKKRIIATEDHRVFTATGWKRVDELQERETVCVNVKKLNLMGVFIDAIRKENIQSIFIAKRRQNIESTTEIYGNTTKDKSLKVILFIMSILMPLITLLKILFVSLPKNTLKYIINIIWALFPKKKQKRLEKNLDIQKKIGRKEELNHLKHPKKEGESVENVAKNTKLQTFIKSIVHQFAENEPTLEKVRRSISAKYAVSYLWLRRIIRGQPVLKNVRIRRQLLKNTEEVFDITTENGEFFANNILVHNCDPFACVRVAIDIRRRELYICDEIYKKDLLNDRAIPLVKQLSHGSIVWCDSAEPKSIAEFRANGINAYAVKKGHGSIEQGINFIKRFRIYVHPSCKNTINELSSYRYKEDSKTGDILPEPVDKDNHALDALRYALERDARMRGTIKEGL